MVEVCIIHSHFGFPVIEVAIKVSDVTQGILCMIKCAKINAANYDTQLINNFRMAHLSDYQFHVVPDSPSICTCLDHDTIRISINEFRF